MEEAQDSELLLSSLFHCWPESDLFEYAGISGAFQIAQPDPPRDLNVV